MEKHFQEVNILPFVCMALGHNRAVYKEIDTLYEKYKVDLVPIMTARTEYSKLFSSLAIDEDTHARRSFGLFLYQESHQDDLQFAKNLFAIIHKGWPMISQFIRGKDSITFGQFIETFMYSADGNTPSMDDLTSTLSILFLSCLNYNVQIVEDDTLRAFLDQMMNTEAFYETGLRRINLNKATESDQTKIADMKNYLKSRLGQSLNVADIISNSESLFLNYLFDFAGLSPYSLLTSVPFDENDIEEILYAYIHSAYEFSTGPDDRLIQYFISGCYSKILLKAYRICTNHK